MPKTSIMFHLSEPMKDALGSFAATHDQTISEVIRQAVTAHIGYDTALEPKRTRESKYRSQEHKQATYNKKARERRALIRTLVSTQDEATIEDARQALKESLG